MMWHGVDPRKIIREEKRMYFAAKADEAQKRAEFEKNPYFIPEIQRQSIEISRRLKESSQRLVETMVVVLNGKLE